MAAFVGIMCTEAEIDQKSGAGVSPSFDSDMKTAATLAAESMVNDVAKFNFSDVWATGLNVDVKYLVTFIVSAEVAVEAISYDMSGYTSRIEAEDMINILRDKINRNLGILREQDVKDWIEENAT